MRMHKKGGGTLYHDQTLRMLPQIMKLQKIEMAAILSSI